MVNSKKTVKGRPRTSVEPAGKVQGLQRGLILLEHISAAMGGVSLTDLAERVELPNSTTHRLLSTLEQQGFVCQHQANGFWHIGVKAFTVGNAFLENRDFVTLARPVMQQLVSDISETCNLAILDNSQVVFIAQVESPELMRMVAKLGSRRPVHVTAVGKALLSSRSNADIASLLEDYQYTQFTARTLLSTDQLLQDLEVVKRRGFAVDDEEQALGLRCIAANICNEYGEAVAAISISGPTQRVSRERVEHLGASVAAAAATISQLVGGNLPASTASQEPVGFNRR